MKSLRKFLFVISVTMWGLFRPPLSFAEDYSKQNSMLVTLYRELIRFRGDPRFFSGRCGEKSSYCAWNKSVLRLNKVDGYNRYMLVSYGVTSFDLWQMGREYLLSMGQETPYTKAIRSDFEVFVKSWHSQ